MSTSIELSRRTPYYKIDDLIHDQALALEAEHLQGWLAQQNYGSLTPTTIYDFVLQTQPLAVLERSLYTYSYYWSYELGAWVKICTEVATIVYPTQPGVSPIQLSFERSAEY